MRTPTRTLAARCLLRVAASLPLLVGLPAGLAAQPAGGAHDLPELYWAARLGQGLLRDPTASHGLRLQSSPQQTTGMVLGANLTRHLSVELAGDVVETNLTVPGIGKTGEYGMLALVPQVRLRYPVLEGALVPYLVGGVGLLHGEVNDRRPRAGHVRIRGSETTAAVTLGAGLEYLVAPGVAVGAEARYLATDQHEIEIDGRRHALSVDGLLLTAGVRLQVPAGGEAAEAALADTRWWRPYFALRIGGAATLRDDLGRGIDWRTEYAGLPPFSQFYGGMLGVELGRHLALEIAAEGFEPRLTVPGFGTIGEYAVYLLIAQARVRWPILGGRVVPYLLAGLGGSFVEVNDVKPHAAALRPSGQEWGLAGTLGAGIEYVLTRHIAVGLESKLLLTGGHAITLAGERRDVRPDAVLTSLAVRVYLGR
jgi:opacity protein-like surface antigen